MSFSNPIIGSLGRLIRQAIRSVNFVTGVSGWSIEQDGGAEFNNVTVRGSVKATAPNGAYVQVYADDTAGRVDLRPPDSAGSPIVPASLVTAITNPKSPDPALEIHGPAVNGEPGPTLYLNSGGTVYLDANYSWLRTTDGTSWNVNGDWELYYYDPVTEEGGTYFQIQMGNRGKVLAGSYQGGKYNLADESDPNQFKGTAFSTTGDSEDTSLRVNNRTLSAQYELARQEGNGTLTLTSNQLVPGSAPVVFAKDNMDALTSSVVRMNTGCRSSVANAVVQFGVRITRASDGVLVGDVDVCRAVCTTANAAVHTSGVARVLGLNLAPGVDYRAQPFWRLRTGAATTITMDPNHNLSIEIEERPV